MKLPIKQRPLEIKNTDNLKSDLKNILLSIEQLWNKVRNIETSTNQKVSFGFNAETNNTTSIIKDLHNKVTVVDSDSIDITLLGQQISAKTVGLSIVVSFIDKNDTNHIFTFVNGLLKEYKNSIIGNTTELSGTIELGGTDEL